MMLSSFWCCLLCATTWLHSITSLFNFQSTAHIINSSSPCLRVLPLLLFLVCTVYCECYIASLMNMRGLFVHLYLVRVRAVVVALEAVEMTAALLVCACITKHEQLMNWENKHLFSLSVWRTRKGRGGVFSRHTHTHTWEIWRTGKKRRGGAESRICVTPNDIAHFKAPVFVQFTICDEGQLVEQSSEKRQRIYNCNSKYFVRGRPMIKFISFCPKMINSADFVIPTIMPTQWLFFPLKYEY